MNKKKTTNRPQTPEEVIRKRRIRLRDKAAVSSLIKKTIVLVIAVYVIFGIIFGLTPMKGNDMEPNLSTGDLLLYYRLESDYVRNDVIVMKRNGKQYVGRIIGMPGDTINITTSGTINIDGSNVIEEGIYFETRPYPGAGTYPRKLGTGEYFILADKRDTAKDSRYFGSVRKDEIKGKVITSIRRMNI